MIRAAVILATILLPSLASSSRVAAHVLESDNGIGAVLHIDPEDNPIAGKESSLYFDFKNKNGSFDTNTCDCRLKIERAGAVIYNELFNLPAGSTYTFPARDIYTVHAIGKPNGSVQFAPFDLAYDVRVERGDSSDSNISSRSENLPFLISGTIGLFFILFIIRYKIVQNIK